MTEKLEKEQTISKWSWIKVSLVFVAVVSLSIVMYIKLTLHTTETNAGEFAEMRLPEGSTVFLNAESHVSYTPYWWKKNRTIKFNGEAFFLINKGKPVSIWSERGTVITSGASFNLFCRDNIYQIYCKSGSLTVKTLLSGRVVLNAGEYTSLEDNYLDIEKVNEEQYLAWRENEFNYVNIPLEKVLIDFKRHYDVFIACDTLIGRNMNYTGEFSRELPIERALDTVCLDLGISYHTQATDTFRILSLAELSY